MQSRVASNLLFFTSLSPRKATLLLWTRFWMNFIEFQELWSTTYRDFLSKIEKWMNVELKHNSILMTFLSFLSFQNFPIFQNSIYKRKMHSRGEAVATLDAYVANGRRLTGGGNLARLSLMHKSPQFLHRDEFTLRIFGSSVFNRKNL